MLGNAGRNGVGSFSVRNLGNTQSSQWQVDWEDWVTFVWRCFIF